MSDRADKRSPSDLSQQGGEDELQDLIKKCQAFPTGPTFVTDPLKRGPGRPPKSTLKSVKSVVNLTQLDDEPSNVVEESVTEPTRATRNANSNGTERTPSTRNANTNDGESSRATRNANSSGTESTRATRNANPKKSKGNEKIETDTPSQPLIFKDPAVGQFLGFLQKTIADVSKNNAKLDNIIEQQQLQIRQQQELINSLNERVLRADMRISVLESQVDGLLQDKLANRLQISGTAAEAFIRATPEYRDGVRRLGLHSLRSLGLLVASKTATIPVGTPEEELNIGDVSDGTQVADADLHPAIKKLKDEQAITSASIFADSQDTLRIAVTTATRDAAMAILTKGKATKRALFFSEELTERRRNIMYELRQTRRRFPLLNLSVFSRNGTPAVRIGEQRRPTLIASHQDLDRFHARLRTNPGEY